MRLILALILIAAYSPIGETSSIANFSYMASAQSILGAGFQIGLSDRLTLGSSYEEVSNISYENSADINNSIDRYSITSEFYTSNGKSRFQSSWVASAGLFLVRRKVSASRRKLVYNHIELNPGQSRYGGQFGYGYKWFGKRFSAGASVTVQMMRKHIHIIPINLSIGVTF